MLSGHTPIEHSDHSLTLTYLSTVDDIISCLLFGYFSTRSYPVELDPSSTVSLYRKSASPSLPLALSPPPLSLPSLSHITLTCIPIPSLPPSLSLPSLSHIILTYIPIPSLPPSLSLPSLSHITLTCIPTPSLPPSLFECYSTVILLLPWFIRIDVRYIDVHALYYWQANLYQWLSSLACNSSLHTATACTHTMISNSHVVVFPASFLTVLFILISDQRMPVVPLLCPFTTAVRYVTIPQLLSERLRPCDMSKAIFEYFIRRTWHVTRSRTRLLSFL